MGRELAIDLRLGQLNVVIKPLNCFRFKVGGCGKLREGKKSRDRSRNPPVADSVGSSYHCHAGRPDACRSRPQVNELAIEPNE